MAKKEWREFEQLVARIQQDLAPDAKVEHDVMLVGEVTGERRQVDVLLTQNIGQYTMRVAIDCKDYKTPVDVKGVEEFSGLVDDIGVNKGVLVCPAGFTATAKKRAKSLRIALYRPLDTGDHKWRSVIALPAVCDFFSAGISISISSIAAKPFRIGEHPGNMRVLSPQGDELPTAFQMAIEKWNAGEFPVAPGEHHDLPLYEHATVQVSNGYDDLIDVQLTASILVERVRYFGQVGIKQLSGFVDEHTGLVHTNAFTTGAVEPEEIQNTWVKLADGEEPPRKPILAIQGLVGWESP
ncbi:restriction endonuclease [Burkholderia diffusa]|uniref:restriction endonuclease n=1 Tax=Burkholderia diffusa TaxID=488732 RepID=UPI001583B368|nr:restriction endonuclease [Burkholderia diffusa]